MKFTELIADAEDNFPYERADEFYGYLSVERAPRAKGSRSMRQGYRQILMFIWVAGIFCAMLGRQVLLAGALLTLWAILFADLFGAFFALIAIAGINLMAMALRNSLLSLIIVSVSVIILVFDVVSFTIFAIRQRKQFFFRVSEEIKKQMLSELKKYELCHILWRKLAIKSDKID